MRVKMAEALALAKLFSAAEVDWALGHAAVHARFAEADLPAILDHHHACAAAGPLHRAGEDHSLTQGTARWAALGGPATPDQTGDHGQTGQTGETGETGGTTGVAS